MSDGKITMREAGRRGGIKGGQVTKERHGSSHYAKIGKKGGETRKANADYSKLGKLGGEARKAQLGPGGYEQLGKKGGARMRELVRRGQALSAQNE